MRKPAPGSRPKDKQCPACGTNQSNTVLKCGCGHLLWGILGGGYESGAYKLVGEIPHDIVNPLLYQLKVHNTGCASITPKRVRMGEEMVKVRLRSSFAAYRDNPACIACGRRGTKWLVIDRTNTLFGKPHMAADNFSKHKRQYSLMFVSDNYIPMTIDHIQPKSRGGQNDISNYGTMCWDCNVVKSNLTLQEFREWLSDSQGATSSPAGPTFW